MILKKVIKEKYVGKPIIKSVFIVTVSAVTAVKRGTSNSLPKFCGDTGFDAQQKNQNIHYELCKRSYVVCYGVNRRCHYYASLQRSGGILLCKCQSVCWPVGQSVGL